MVWCGLQTPGEENVGEAVKDRPRRVPKTNWHSIEAAKSDPKTKTKNGNTHKHQNKSKHELDHHEHKIGIVHHKRIQSKGEGDISAAFDLAPTQTT